MKNRSNDYYDSSFKNGENAKQNYFRDSVGVGMWTGNGSEELLSVYMTVAEYQLQYFEYYGFPYNFHNDKSYAEEIGMDNITDTQVTETLADFTVDEIREIEEALGEDALGEIRNDINGENAKVSNSPNIWIVVIIIALVIGVFVVLKMKNQKV